MLLDLVWDAPGVLNDFAIHVANVQAAIGCIGEVDDAHPGVFGCRKFEAVFVRRTLADEANAVFGRTDDLAVHKLSSRVTRKAIVHELGTVGIATKDRGASCTGEIATDSATTFDHTLYDARDAPAGADDAPRFVRADAEDFRCPTVGRDALA